MPATKSPAKTFASAAARLSKRIAAYRDGADIETAQLVRAIDALYRRVVTWDLGEAANDTCADLHRARVAASNARAQWAAERRSNRSATPSAHAPTSPIGRLYAAHDAELRSMCRLPRH